MIKEINPSNLPLSIWNYILERTDFESYTRYNNRIGVKEVTTCLRNAYYKRVYDMPSLSDMGRWVIFRGMLFDDVFSKLYEKNAVKLIYEGDNFKIVGKIDFIDEFDEIWELKTINSAWIIRDMPLREHMLQANFYAYLRNDKYYNILYVSFDGIRAFRHIEMLKEDAELIIERAKILIEALNEKKVPEKETSNACKYCQYYHICVKDGDTSEQKKVVKKKKRVK